MQVPSPNQPNSVNGVSNYLYILQRFLSRELSKFASTESPQPFLLVTSPNKSIYKITVSDAGVITATKVQSA